MCVFFLAGFTCDNKGKALRRQRTKKLKGKYAGCHPEHLVPTKFSAW